METHKMSDADDKIARDVLVDQAKALGLTVDKRWSVETLAEKVLEAQQNEAERKQAEFEAAKKTPVRLLKNAFPVASQKALKGTIVEVPIAMARAWIAAGVAERADAFPGE